MPIHCHIPLKGQGCNFKTTSGGIGMYRPKARDEPSIIIIY